VKPAKQPRVAMSPLTCLKLPHRLEVLGKVGNKVLVV